MGNLSLDEEWIYEPFDALDDLKLRSDMNGRMYGHAAETGTVHVNVDEKAGVLRGAIQLDRLVAGINDHNGSFAACFSDGYWEEADSLYTDARFEVSVDELGRDELKATAAAAVHALDKAYDNAVTSFRYSSGRFNEKLLGDPRIRDMT